MIIGEEEPDINVDIEGYFNNEPSIEIFMSCTLFNISSEPKDDSNIEERSSSELSDSNNAYELTEEELIEYGLVIQKPTSPGGSSSEFDTDFDYENPMSKCYYFIQFRRNSKIEPIDMYRRVKPTSDARCDNI